MKAIITGSRGTIGSALFTKLKESGHEVLGWDREAVPISDYWAMEQYLREEKPDIVYHLAIPSRLTGMENESWLVNYQWTSELAWICRSLDIIFVYTSSVMVFSSRAQGPFDLNSRPDAGEGYGYEKRLAEERTFYQNVEARVFRLGWQIDTQTGTNNMMDYLDEKMGNEGIVTASTQWYPACSFLQDTVEILMLAPKLKPGLYQFDGNEKWSFYQIAFALNLQEKKNWKVVPSDNFVYDQRMMDPRLPLKSIARHIKSLK